MRRYIVSLLAAATLVFAGCGKKVEPKVMARAVPERADDFVFENDLVAGRFYGKALEGDPTSPGLDIWVKLPGKLVADEWYAHALTEGNYYHKDHGGKDCYKVAVSLGGGASVPFVDGRLCWPATNYRSCEILESGPEKVVFTLDYPAWEVAEGVSVSLVKKVTVTAGTYFTQIEDTYTCGGTDMITVAAGFKLHGEQKTVREQLEASDRLAIWEKASDQSVEPEDGMIGVSVVMPDADSAFFSEELDHALLIKRIPSGGTLSYSVGSCWSKADIKIPSAWFDLVREQ
ncbi:MAG: DUF4861 family protein [Bacteroidales bacterium]|nr:DUF4861 family protein [Bacteroidales bacterium]